jgi:hypothetical protein
LIKPSTGNRRLNDALTDAVARDEIHGWFTRENMKFAFFRAASDLYANAVSVSSKEILGDDSIGKSGLKIRRWLNVSRLQ